MTRPIPLTLAGLERLLLPRCPTRVAAGFPSPAEDHADDPIDLIERLIPNRMSSYLFDVAGDSMEGGWVHDGDVCIVDRSLPHADGRIVVATVDGGFTIKLLRRSGGRAQLLALPGRGGPRVMPYSDDVRVWGVVRSTVTPHLGGSLQSRRSK